MSKTTYRSFFFHFKICINFERPIFFWFFPISNFQTFYFLNLWPIFINFALNSSIHKIHTMISLEYVFNLKSNEFWPPKIETWALSLYRSKMILDCPNLFRLFLLSANHFGQVEIRLFWINFFQFGSVQNDLDSTKMNWTSLKQLVLDQNDLDVPKSFWTRRRSSHQFNNLTDTNEG